MLSDSDHSRHGSEHSPLLGRPPTPVLDRTMTPSPFRKPQGSIFTCAIVCILFTELCERLTFYGINGNLVLFATHKNQLDITPSEASIMSYIFQGKVGY